jgi:hypothetical protein
MVVASYRRTGTRDFYSWLFNNAASIVIIWHQMILDNLEWFASGFA